MKRSFLACIALLFFLLSGCGDSSQPAVDTTAVDTTPPVISSFSMPATAASLEVPITAFEGMDGSVPCAGYMITETSTPPLASDPGWAEKEQTSFTFSSAGTKTAYAWAKDKAGNVSLAATATVTITLPVPPVQLTTAVLKISTQGTLDAGTSLSGVGITLNLPAGVTVKTDAGGAVDPGVVTVSGGAVPSTLVAPLFTPATTGTNATLTFAVASNTAGGFNVGEFATVTCDIAPGSFPTAADFTLSGLTPGDLFLQAVTGLTASMLVDLR